MKHGPEEWKKKIFMGKKTNKKHGFHQPALSSQWVSEISVQRDDLGLWNINGCTLSIEWQFNIQKKNGKETAHFF